MISVRGIARSATRLIGVKPGWQYRFLPYRHLRTDRAQVNVEYSSGHWAGLASIGEAPRHSIIAGYCRQLNPHAAILDIGCGDGTLQATLHSYSRYLGVDLSDEAIRNASVNCNERTTFKQGDASTFNPYENFDIVVFNECLFYFEDPAAVVKRYERALKERGLFIVSMYEMGLDRLIWKKLEASYAVRSAVRITNSERVSWNIKVMTQ